MYDEGLRTWSPENFTASSSGFEASQAKVCHKRAPITLPVLVCMCACLPTEKLNLQTIALMMQALRSGSLTLALLHYLSRHLQGLYGVLLKSF